MEGNREPGLGGVPATAGGQSAAHVEVWAMVSPGRVAIALAVAIALLGLAGASVVVHRFRLSGWVDLDDEWNLPALFSALLLVLAAIALVRLRHRWERPYSLVPLLFSALLLFAALDEVAQIHEGLEQSLEVDWQTLYFPGFLVAMVLWFLVLVGLWGDRLVSALFVASGAAWVWAQLLEFFAWDANNRRVEAYDVMMVGEEVLEMTGTALLLLVFLYARDANRRALSLGKNQAGASGSDSDGRHPTVTTSRGARPAVPSLEE